MTLVWAAVLAPTTFHLMWRQSGSQQQHTTTNSSPIWCSRIWCDLLPLVFSCFSCHSSFWLKKARRSRRTTEWLLLQLLPTINQELHTFKYTETTETTLRRLSHLRFLWQVTQDSVGTLASTMPWLRISQKMKVLVFRRCQWWNETPKVQLLTKPRKSESWTWNHCVENYRYTYDLFISCTCQRPAQKYWKVSAILEKSDTESAKISQGAFLVTKSLKMSRKFAKVPSVMIPFTTALAWCASDSFAAMGQGSKSSKPKMSFLPQPANYKVAKVTGMRKVNSWRHWKLILSCLRDESSGTTHTSQVTSPFR